MPLPRRSPSVIELDRDRINQQTRGLADLLQAVNIARGNTTRPNPDVRTQAITQLSTPPLTQGTARQLALLDDFHWSIIANESQRVPQDILKDRIPTTRVDEIKGDVPLRVSPFFSETDRAVVVELVQRLYTATRC